MSRIGLRGLTVALALSVFVSESWSLSLESRTRPKHVYKQQLVELLRQGDNDISSSSVIDEPISNLVSVYDSEKIDACFSTEPSYNGLWKEVRPPAFVGQQGFNQHGEPLYPLSRLTMGQIKPAKGKDVICSVQRMTQSVDFLKRGGPLPQLPDSLRDVIEASREQLRTFHIDTHFSVHEYDVKGVLRMEGYVFPHPKVPNRFETWFLHGRCLCRFPDTEAKAWQKLFGSKPSLSWRRRLFGRRTPQLVEDPALFYSLGRPAAAAHQTVLFMDKDLRITRGHRGTRIIVERWNE